MVRLNWPYLMIHTPNVIWTLITQTCTTNWKSALKTLDKLPSKLFDSIMFRFILSREISSWYIECYIQLLQVWSWHNRIVHTQLSHTQLSRVMMNSYLLLLTVSMTTVYHQDLWWFIILVFWKSNSCIFILNFFSRLAWIISAWALRRVGRAISR